MVTKAERLTSAVAELIAKLPQAERAEVQLLADRYPDPVARYAIVKVEVGQRLTRAKAQALREKVKAKGLKRIAFHVPASQVAAAKAAMQEWAQRSGVPLTLAQASKQEGARQQQPASALGRAIG